MNARFTAKFPALILFVIIVFFLSGNSFASRKIFSGDNLKKQIKIYYGQIVRGSDSLVLEGSLLVRGTDYTIDYNTNLLNLNRETESDDTLIVHYLPLPNWVKRSYGFIPEAREVPDDSRSEPAGTGIQRQPVRRSTTLNISGAKKFSIISQAQGLSQFNQTLELTIGGELSPGLTISGSISDRGYDPAYGTINSRISELDKLYLKIQSTRFSTEIGNLEILQPNNYGTPQVKQISGVKANYADRNLSGSALLARPRGNFRTARFNGNNQMQGPYRIIAENQLTAIVPGSERVWLDGVLLERGAEKDYTMDYPAGTITFTPYNIIDSRSRIEIDFEPLTTDYEKEMYQAGAGYSFSDSIFSARLMITREGDDREQLKTGELSDDDIALLESIGDNDSLNFISGVLADTNGAYIEAFDSLGDRYFEYVGDSLGEYRINFSSVGSGNGDYVYEGRNVYRYVGSGKGEFLPVMRVPIPIREDFIEADFEYHPSEAVQLRASLKQSNFDKNLYSPIDDNDNRGGQYVFSGVFGHDPELKTARSGFKFNVDLVEKNFKARTRRNRPDFQRTYYIPFAAIGFNSHRDMRGLGSVAAPGPYNLHAGAGYFSYGDKFNSYRGTFGIYPDSSLRFLPDLSYTRLQSEFDTSGIIREGKVDIFKAHSIVSLTKKIKLTGNFRFDRRTNEYSGFKRGTTENEYILQAGYGAAAVKYQHFHEDTLIAEWRERYRRDRITLSHSQTIGSIRSDIYVAGQRYRQEDIEEDQLLMKLKLSYNPESIPLRISTDYALSRENRYERGIRYIEVEPGQGTFIFEDSQYIPDPEGNYIKVEEIHSNQAPVSRGEKAFALNYSPSGVYLRLNAIITEELLPESSRNALWTIPFYSDKGNSYLYHKLNYTGDLKLLSYPGYYAINLSVSHNYEDRTLGGVENKRYENVYRIVFNEESGGLRFEQKASYFQYFRDAYYTTRSNLSGYRVEGRVIRSPGFGQVGGFAAFRSAEDESGAFSRQYIIGIDILLRAFEGGESEFSIEPYYQELEELSGSSYLLTDNRNGSRGVVWSVRSNYRISGDLRFTLSFSGNHSNERAPRISGRGELIASF